MPGEDDDGERAASPQADAAARFSAALGDAVAAAAATFTPLVHAAAAMLQALAADPVVRFVMEHPELLRSVRPQRCWCLYDLTHPGVAGVCDAYEAVTTRRYATTALGVVEVPLCGPCATAQGSTARLRLGCSLRCRGPRASLPGMPVAVTRPSGARDAERRP
jgi:hypothetical protein